ncbi:MAG: HNH endonuclease [Propionibacteriaceae bacterium]|nr:HNH endonuclease [Propionibacteriaceae bacterium]
MHAVVAVTDNDWARFLRERPGITEANFWMPSGGPGFRRPAGEPFLFKTHLPHNQLVGGGFVSGFTRLKVSEAWDFFGEGNGVESQQELLNRLYRYRSGPRELDPVIGCVLLRDLFFVPDRLSVPAPPDFSPYIVRWKYYELTNATHVGKALERLLAGSGALAPLDTTAPVSLGPTRGSPTLTVPRLGQQAFKSMVLTAYHRRCAITGDKITPVLQAAHIRPVSEQGEHRVDNGLLLRSDVHILFDRGYLGVDDKYRLQVSSRLRSDFGNGQEFYDRASSMIALPDRRSERPNKDAVSWHMDTKFLR